MYPLFGSLVVQLSQDSDFLRGHFSYNFGLKTRLDLDHLLLSRGQQVVQFVLPLLNKK